MSKLVKKIAMICCITSVITVVPIKSVFGAEVNKGQVVSAKAEAIESGYVSTNGTALNVRSAANTSSKILGKLANKTKVDVVDKSVKGWYKIKYNGGYAYVSSEYIKLNKPAETIKIGYVLTNGANLNVRSSTNTSCKILGQLADGTKVDLVDSSVNGWYKIKYNGGYGYVSSAYISLNKPTTNTSGPSDINLGNVGQSIVNFNSIGYKTKSTSSVNYGGIVGECVWYVRGRADEKGFKTYGIRGNAKEWFGQAKKYGAPTSTDINAIKSNSIMCRGSGNYGHVVYIEYVDTNSPQKWVYYTEANVEAPYSDGKISNADGKLKKMEFSKFKTNVAKSGTGFQGYIYLNKKSI